MKEISSSPWIAYTPHFGSLRALNRSQKAEDVLKEFAFNPSGINVVVIPLV